MGIKHLQCPDYTLLPKRLSQLVFSTPRFKKSDEPDADVVSIAIDSTKLKRFGKDEWHQVKPRGNAKRISRKAHFAVDNSHLIQSTVLTDKNTMDDLVVKAICSQITEGVTHVTADKIHDTNTMCSLI
ncbi:transposase [Vibrio splendidus]